MFFLSLVFVSVHIGICLHLGWTREQIGSLLNDVSILLGEEQVKAIRKLY